MALVLAIEPDRRQAARISALGRGALDAELLIADSTERAVAALHGRHPDLILTSLLLSPKDDAGLRDFESSGVPVPTLMSPVLAGSSRGSSENGGLLARLRRQASSSHEGCDPKVFAAQITEYLSRMREEQEADALDHESIEPATSIAPTAAAPAVNVQPAAASIEEEFLDADPAIESEPIVEAVESEPVTEMSLDSSSIETPLGITPSLETRMAARTQPDADWEEIVIEEHEDGFHRVIEDEDVTIELSSDVDLQAFVDELKATYADLFPVQEVQRAQSEASPRKTIAHELSHRACWPSLEGIAAEDAPVFDEVVADFVAAMDEPGNPRGGDADSDLWMPLSPAPGLAWPRLESACSKRPPQDEWGFYDPDQCGLSAVVAKLNQVTR